MSFEFYKMWLKHIIYYLSYIIISGYYNEAIQSVGAIGNVFKGHGCSQCELMTLS